MSKKQERINQILALFNEKEYLSCKQLAGRLGISEMTVRRDLAYLQESNIVTRGPRVGTFVLSALNAHTAEDYELSSEEIKNAPEKDAIGKFAVSLISPGDTLIIDTGTTTSRFAHNIPANLEFSALCYNFAVFKELMRCSSCDLTLAGGQFNSATSSFSSPECLATINQYRANKFFMAASGVHQTLGLTCAYKSEISNKRAAIHSSLTKILLADSSKFGCVRAAYFDEISTVDIIVTDSKLSQEWRDYITGLGINLYIV